MLESTILSIKNLSVFKEKAIYFANLFPTFCYLESNNYQNDKYSQFDWSIAIDAIETIESSKNSFQDLYNKIIDSKEWWFGYFGYDLKNEVEDLDSKNEDFINAKELFFLKPRYLIQSKNGKVSINRNFIESNSLVETIEAIEITGNNQQSITLRNQFSKEEYLKTVHKIQNNIEEGDVYELNLCTEYFTEKVDFNPVSTFFSINELSKAPFSAFLKQNNIYTLCASPERFLQKKGNQLVAQPIKGTIRKSSDKVENELLKKQLQEDEKERAENVMIVDLMRNDLTKSAETGSINVTELFEVYEFATINQLISTVEATLKTETNFIEAIKNAFPMGSMTGAPKVKAMELIEQYEKTKRGIYSGSIGYFSPENDFDFNVVIRSLNYNSITKYLSLIVGGAITYDSIPEKEWEEIQTKAQAILKVLRN